jgi:hypothetical protein
MDRNTAIVEIVLNAAENIRLMALDAIDKLDSGWSEELIGTEGLTNLSPEFTTAFNEAIDRVSENNVALADKADALLENKTPTSTSTAVDGEKKKRGRPRKNPEESEASPAATVVAEPEAPTPAKEVIETEEKPESVNALEDTDLLEWFKANPGAAKERALQFASKHMSDAGVDAARERIKEVTGRVRISDCGVEELHKYVMSFND